MFFFAILLQTAFALSNAQPAIDPVFESVVLIRTEALDDSYQPAPAYCNGTLISAQQIVTAAHCVAQAFVLGKPQIRVEVGHYVFGHRPNGQIFRAGYAPYLANELNAQFNLKPSLIQRLQRGGVNTQIPPEEDIAVITLSESLVLPAEFQFAKRLPLALKNEVLGHPAQFQPQVVTINPMEEVTTSDTKRVALLNDFRTSGSYGFESKSTARVAPMDSGAPVFVTVQGQMYLLAVVKGLGQTIFSSWDAYTFADTW